MTEAWETIEVPKGSFISWGDRPGQEVVGRVLDYDATGGTDFNDQPCPQLSVELTADAYSVNKAGERFDHGRGDVVTLNCGLANLKRAIRAAALDPGDLVSIRFDSTDRADKGTVKVFVVKVARGAGRRTSEPASSAPPF